MQIEYSKKFKKQLKKAPKKIQIQFIDRLSIFMEDEHAPILKNHKLSGGMENLRSINITADWRALYNDSVKNRPLFVLLGTHSQLYK